jgi:DNA invertase Pin-like site-specific DNA recombinase
MLRVAIYSRYSSDLQNDRSIADQLALCQDYALRHGWAVVKRYADHAISGASIHGRTDYQRMVADAEQGLFDKILAEDIDRFSRNQADGARLYERMQFLGVPIWTVADGETNEMHWGLKGTMSALFLKNHALKVRRGQAGRAREGKIPGGLCYGYRVLRQTPSSGELTRGDREIMEDEAKVVRRIFRDTIAGLTPREIAAALNKESIPAPRGGVWNASTINGSRKRQNGILRQSLYAGKLSWNRQHFVKNPDTGKRVSRMNAATDRYYAEVPHLRIVAEDDWARVQTIMANKRNENDQTVTARRRSPHLFSGLIKCGQCGRSYVSAGGSKWPRFQCSGRRETGSCTNSRMISAQIIEERTLLAIEDDLLDEEVIAAAVREYVTERRRLKAEREAKGQHRSRRLGELGRAINALIGAIEKGADADDVLPRLRQLQSEKRRLEAEQAEHPVQVIEMHPGLPDRYRALVRDLRLELARRPHNRKAEVIASIRSLVGKIVVYPHNDLGRDLELVGELAAVLGPVEKVASSMRGLVAEEGFEPPTHGL